jgi:hypothetical protein
MELARDQYFLQGSAIDLPKLASRWAEIAEELKIGVLYLSMSGGAAAKELAGGIQLLVNLDSTYEAQLAVV